MLSAPNFQLSGSGWYATDFKDKTPKNASSKAGSEKASNEAPASTEAAPAACKTGCACH